ncbi:MAG TPA: methylated-DNA--[protein]-cysteine S-methyltransferase [Phycisphaerae bacterium]
MIRFTILSTSWGPFALINGARGLLASHLPGVSERALLARIRRDWPGAVEDAAQLGSLRGALVDYFDGDLEVDPARLDVPLDLSEMTPFRRRVMLACRAIPRGQTRSYADLARCAGVPGATRAAGSVMAHNPLGLLVPCHRVLRSDGSLGGFSSPGGVKLKRRLLEHEGAWLPARPESSPAASAA